ncbi:MAG: serine/threonine protein kinase [Gammaproteobacteria bacterium]
MTNSDETGAADDATLAYLGLQPDDILDAVESLDYRSDGRLLALNSYENRVYRVGIEDQRPVVTKFYRPARWSDAGILEEHEFAIELANQDIPVVPPNRHGGATLHHHGPFRFSVSDFRGGRTPELDDMDLLRQIGRLVARIHLCGERRPFVHRPALDMDSFGVRSRDFLLGNRMIPAELEPAYTSICEHLFDGIRGCYARAGESRQLRLHADFHPANVLVDGEVVHIVDLDDTRMGPAVQDLWMFLSGDRAEQTPQLEELLEGYTEFRSFDARELHLIEALRTLRIMHYAAWLARRWRDPAFQRAFPWFESRRYWDDHILALREQAALMEEAPLAWNVSWNR